MAAERKKEYACGCRPRGLFPVRCQTAQRLRREVDKAYYAALVDGDWDAYASARTRYRLIQTLATYVIISPWTGARWGIGTVLWPRDRGRAGEIATANFVGFLFYVVRE